MIECMFKKGSVVFVFKSNSPAISKAGIHFKLCGYRGERLTISPYGEAVPKMYEYPGIPHLKLARGIILVEAANVAKVEELFNRYQIPYLKIRPRSISNHHFL